MCHEKSFLFFSGISKEILYDNMKTIVEERNRYGKELHKYHPKMMDLSKKCGFKIRLCKPYRAKTKGKVERFNSYLKGNFYRPFLIELKDAGLDVTVQILNEHIGRWLNKANKRIHGTTKKQPSELFIYEAKFLIKYCSTLHAKPGNKMQANEQVNKPKLLPHITVHKPNLQQYDQLLMEAEIC